MHRYWIFTLCTWQCLPWTAKAQAELLYPWELAGDRFDWSTVQVIDDTLSKQRLIQQHPEEFEVYLMEDAWGDGLVGLMHDLHVIDLNGDGLGDIIFDGESGSEARAIRVFLNRDGRFDLILDAQQTVAEMRFTDGRLDRLYVVDKGCCAETVHLYQVFRFVHEGLDTRASAEPVIMGCQSLFGISVLTVDHNVLLKTKGLPLSRLPNGLVLLHHEAATNQTEGISE